MRFSICRSSWGIAVLALFAGTSASAEGPVDTRFKESTFTTGLSRPTGMAWATDGSNVLFVTQKAGQLRAVRNGILQSAVVASIPTYDAGAGEAGLDGIAVHPNYGTNKWVYVFATFNTTTQKIWRVTIGQDGAGNLVGTGLVQIGIDMPSAGGNHNGGGMAFGPGNLLYFGCGNNGDNTNLPTSFRGAYGFPDEWTTLGSKIGCMDENGNPVSTNPWYVAQDGRSPKNYMFARGFRNPFGLRVHPTTGALWLTEVGANWEQVFLVTRGSNQGYGPNSANFGEHNYPGLNGYNPNLLTPKYDYGTGPWGSTVRFGSSTSGCITRGAFYPPNRTEFPESHRGNLFVADYVGGTIGRLILDSTGNNVVGAEVFVNGKSQLVDVTVGPDGALYYLSLNGTIYRLQYTGTANQGLVVSPTSLTINEGASGSFTVKLAAAPSSNVVVNATRTSGSTTITNSPSTLTFTASNWSTPQTVTVSAAEDSNTTDETATITCSSSGVTSVNVSVTAKDNDTAINAPTVAFSAPLNGDVVSGANVDWYGSVSDPQGIATVAKVEFFVDGVLKYTDSNPGTDTGWHPHYGGDHLSWDTTTLSNGAHTLMMKAWDITGLSGSAQISVTVSNTVSGATNLARNKPVFASSVQLAGLEAQKAVDGSLGTRWSSVFSDPQWIYVDLGASYSVNKVVLKWETAYGKAYQIQVSQDAATWTTVYSRTNGVGGTETLSFTAASARYVRMYGTQRGTAWGYSLWEFEVYGN